MPAEQVEEIVHVAATVRVPGQPSLIDGFLNLRGRPVAVVQFSRLFGRGAWESGLYNPVIVVKTAGGAVGLKAEAVQGVARIERSAIDPVSDADSLNGCAAGQFVSDEGTVTVLSTERILLEKEQRCLADLAEQARSRIAALEPRSV